MWRLALYGGWSGAQARKQMISDRVVLDDWYVVAASRDLAAGSLLSVKLMQEEVLLWRGSDGQVHAWEDRCPHRGCRFSIGKVKNDKVVCPYHGWEFAGSGACTLRPAHPHQEVPKAIQAKPYSVEEHYGLIWVCLGTPAQPVLDYPEFQDPKLRQVLCGPYDVAAAPPRVIENFLDQAHFSYVHAGILGLEEKAEVKPYKVERDVDGCGVVATDLHFWQPQTNALIHGGSDVEYAYRCPRPFTAILTKKPAAQEGYSESILLTLQPLDEEHVKAWIILSMTNFEQSEEDLRSFQDTIFLQDLPIVENQVPVKLPLDPRAEMPQPADLLSAQYRRWLLDLGLEYGVIRPAV